MVIVLKSESAKKILRIFNAFENLSFEVKEGKIFDFLGVNRVGKITTFKIFK